MGVEAMYCKLCCVLFGLVVVAVCAVGLLS